MSLIDDLDKKCDLCDANYMMVCYSGLAVTAEKDSSGYNLTLADENGDERQSFMFTSRGDDIWEISLAEDGGYCLDISGCSRADGAKLIAYPRNNTNAQRFKAEKDNDGYRLLTAASGYKKYLAVADDGKTLIQSSLRDEKSLWSIC